jgi:cytohesin
MSLAPMARGHETDQFTPPAGREFADIGDELTKTAYNAIDRGVNKINAKIKGEIDAGKSGEQFQSPDALAASVNSEIPPAMFLIDDYDKRVLLPASKMNYPGEIVGYKPSTTVRKYVELPLNPFNAWECATIKAYGVTMGTDKIGHFTDMGMHYYRAYRKAIKEGSNEDQARAKAVWIGTDDFIYAESGLLGWATAGAYSNADLVANFSGMLFYRNLSEPTMLKGAVRPPMVVRDGPYWKIAPHVRPDSQFFSLFFSQHLDEALNPSVYLPKMRDGIRRAIKEHSNDVIERYVDANGNRRGQQYFRDKLTELSTYWGVEYGHKGGATDLLSIPAVCYGNDLAQDAPPTARDRVGRTPLHIAAERGDLATIDRLLKAGADVNVQVRSDEARDTDWGNTPLHLAARDGQVDAVRLLLDRGANINARNDRGVTPLHRSIAHPEVTQLLLDRGAQIDATDTQGRTALHWAAYDPQAKASEVLIARKATVNARDIDGETPMHRAARAANVHVMEVLAAAGGDVNIADKSGSTPLHLAARSNEPAIANLLIHHGAKIDVRDKFGCTPLHDATHARGEGVVAMLIGAGAQRDAANAYGVTPLQLAERTNRVAIAQLIKGTPQNAIASTAAELAGERQAPDEPIQGNPAKKPVAAGN